MNTLQAQRKRLEAEMLEAQKLIAQIKRSSCPDFSLLQQQSEAVERSRQLIGMIDDHVRCDHQPMWRVK